VAPDWGYRRIAVGNSGGCSSGGAEGEDCLVRGQDVVKIHESKNRSGFWCGAGSRVGGYRHASMSSRIGQARMERNSRRRLGSECTG